MVALDLKNLKRIGKGTPPSAADTAHNLSKRRARPKFHLQVKISPEFCRKFSAYAVDHDLEKSTLFEHMCEFYWQKHG